MPLFFNDTNIIHGNNLSSAATFNLNDVEKLFGFLIGEPSEELHPLPKAAEPVWPNQLITGLSDVFTSVT